jgi:hypothetical protein
MKGLLIFLCCFTWLSGVGQENNALKVGVAKVNITPPVPIHMSGYGSRQDVYQGIHDSLYAFAVVFDDGSVQAALITADLIGFSNEFSSRMHGDIEERTGIPVTNILLAATHNHGGPRNNTYGDGEDQRIAAYVDLVGHRIVEAVEQASNHKVPARIGSDKGQCSMNINRRAVFADGEVWLGRNPNGPCDQEVSVIRIDDLSGRPLAILTNWATHGTTSGPTNYQITGDWPGAASRFVEERFGAGVVAPITAGASGDINPIYGPNDRFRDIEAIGYLLAQEVLQVSEKIETYEGASVTTGHKTIEVKGRKPTDDNGPNQALEPADPVEINLSVLKVGGIVLAGISGEVMTEIGMAIKQASPYNHTVIVTHCNGSAGYLVTDKTYQEGGYEAQVSRTMPGTADAIIDNIVQLIREQP